MKWLVKNALNRDVEREHLNKILQDIQDHTNTLTTTTENISTVITNTVLKSFTLKLAGDLTGSVKVNGSGVFTLNAELAQDYVVDVVDDQVYGRTQGAWVLLTTDDVAEGDDNLYFTADRAAEAVANAIDAGASTSIVAIYDSGTLTLNINRKTYQVPVETPDGVLTIFTVPETYNPGSLVVTLNGLVEPITELDDITFQFFDPPEATDTIYLDYF